MNWRLAFPEAFVEVLCRFHSDHNPLFLRFGGLPITRGPRPFRFEAAWIDHKDYSTLVERAWNSSNHNIVTALNTVKHDSINFNHEVFGNIFRRKRHIESRLKGVQSYLERVDSLSHVLLEKELQREYNHILFQEEMLWFQKSREQWVKLGDKNSSFFHAQTIIRRKRNRIHKLQLPNGTWSSDSSILQHEAQNYFKNLFSSSQHNTSSSFNVGTHPTIDEDGRNSLSKPVTKEEVTAALNSMKPYKAPGPDGFQCIFFKQYWHLVGDDIFDLVKTAFHTGYFDPTISDTLISLIPKIDSPTTYRDFRPISLCNIVYKIITKVLVHRLRPILDSIIGPYQSSFLPGRGTSDNAIVLQEIIHFMRRSKRKKGFVAFKLDLEKAFDNVNWDFLKSCLHDFGFPNITIRLIMHCVTSSNFSLLWNGNKLPSFKPTHGLRQGDPLSPYLFILCMEKLSISINSVVHQGAWDPIRISNTGPHLSHLLFADDVLLFTKAKNSQIRFITNLFDRFGLASGLKINLSKSRAFYSSGIPQAKINKLTSLSGIRSTVSLDKYLGFPILKGRAKRNDFNFIIDKMQSRLASWKNRLLNKPGRLALASSVLSSIPTYYMQIAWLPQSICDSIDQTTRKFLWKDSNNKGIHLVGWNKIARPKNLGGLGIRPAREANTSLLGKLVWDMVQSSNKLWVNLLSNKYVAGPEILHSNSHSTGSPTWSSIIHAKNVLKDGFSWRAGSGSSSFWFSHWSPLGYLGTLVPYIDIHDLQLSVKDLKLPSKIIFFFWLVCHNSVPTLSLLNHRKMSNSFICARCGLQEETFLHCVRDCDFSRNIWHHIGFNDPTFFSFTDAREWLKVGSTGSQAYTFSASVWWAWRHRNLMCLNNESWSLNRLSFNIHSMVDIFTSSFSSNSDGTSVSRLIKWNNDNFSCVILNVDGSCLGSPVRAGYGGIIRNDSGFYLSGFSGFIRESSDILLAELYAIYQGLTLAKDLVIDELVCYSDSLLCINLIKGPIVKYHVYAVLIQDIKELISQSNVTLCHTFREGNQCADFLAKLGASSDADLIIHASPPDGIFDLLKSDSFGTFFLRD
ncbi:hypothetical protein TSUD_302460 [Trifolium subterraneum]|uniref:Reverse transcriptase domain-containing protein n=1 Tax=Trifolium subterraneum TaxID=3900 RepID=A0A2Z6N9V0_TRISU|nr:hypothetical protein TSUD_302460 [Trifolium subterraneum]